MKNRRTSIKYRLAVLFHQITIPLILGLACARYPVGDYIFQQPISPTPDRVLPSQFGNGQDGDITVTGNVNITDIYENDIVAGVTTKNGSNRGLNKGAGTYDPKSGVFVQAKTFTIANSATLTASQRSLNDKQGIIWIACTIVCVNNGSIDLTGRGFSGGNAGPNIPGGSNGGNGLGPGGGSGGIAGNPYAGGGGGAGHVNTGSTGATASYSAFSAGGAGGPIYGTSGMPVTNWTNLYGSGGGGGGGGDSNAGAGTSGAGGHGGGALRLFGVKITNTGTISVNGGNAGSGCIASGGGGGGSAGTAYIEGLDEITLGTNTVTATIGAGNTGGNCGGLQSGNGGNGAIGRIHIQGTYTGTTNPIAQ